MNQYKRLLGNTFIFAIGTFSSKILVILDAAFLHRHDDAG